MKIFSFSSVKSHQPSEMDMAKALIEVTGNSVVVCITGEFIVA
jgi:hypothetical protein